MERSTLHSPSLYSNKNDVCKIFNFPLPTPPTDFIDLDRWDFEKKTNERYLKIVQVTKIHILKSFESIRNESKETKERERERARWKYYLNVHWSIIIIHISGIWNWINK